MASTVRGRVYRKRDSLSKERGIGSEKGWVRKGEQRETIMRAAGNWLERVKKGRGERTAEEG